MFEKPSEKKNKKKKKKKKNTAVTIFGSRKAKKCLRTYVKCADYDHHAPDVIRAFTHKFIHCVASNDSVSGLRRPCLDCADT